MKFLTISLFALILTTSLFAEESPLTNITMDKVEIEKNLKLFLDQGKISESDYKKAIQQLGGMNDAQLNDLKNKALGVIKEDPKKAEKMINQKPVPVTTPSPVPAK